MASYYDIGLAVQEPFVDKALAYYRVGKDVYHKTEIGLAVGNIAYRQGMNPDVNVGLALYHTVGDRERAIAQLSTQFATIANELLGSLGWTADHPTIDETQAGYAWYHNVAVPILNEWQTFQARQTDSWWTRWATSWDVYELWMERLKNLRDAADHNGFSIKSPEPQDLMETIWKAAPKQAEDLIWKLIKIVLVGGAVILAGIAILGYIR